jgi:hypothetical protein
MKTEALATPSPESSLKFIDPAQNNIRLDSDENPDLPLEALVISNSGMCSFMGAKSPWANT